ncbi:hypothetical protein BH20ACT13_BH20ACT13_13340 [soil metagenome]
MSGHGERDEHEEQWSGGDQEHDREDGDTLGAEVAVSVERAGEIEPEHPRASIGTERLRRDQRGEERERASRDERVVAVGDEVVDGEILEDHRKGHRDESGEKGDRERDRRQHFVAAVAPEPEHAPHASRTPCRCGGLGRASRFAARDRARPSARRGERAPGRGRSLTRALRAVAALSTSRRPGGSAPHRDRRATARRWPVARLPGEGGGTSPRGAGRGRSRPARTGDRGARVRSRCALASGCPQPRGRVRGRRACHRRAHEARARAR